MGEKQSVAPWVAESTQSKTSAYGPGSCSGPPGRQSRRSEASEFSIAWPPSTPDERGDTCPPQVNAFDIVGREGRLKVVRIAGHEAADQIDLFRA